MLKDDAYQQIEKIAQERGVSMDSEAAHTGIYGPKLLNPINRITTAFFREKIGSMIQALSPIKKVIKAVNLNGKDIAETIESIVDYTE